MSDIVGNPEELFSHNEAHIIPEQLPPNTTPNGLSNRISNVGINKFKTFMMLVFFLFVLSIYNQFQSNSGQQGRRFVNHSASVDG